MELLQKFLLLELMLLQLLLELALLQLILQLLLLKLLKLVQVLLRLFEPIAKELLFRLVCIEVCASNGVHLVGCGTAQATAMVIGNAHSEQVINDLARRR